MRLIFASVALASACTPPLEPGGYHLVLTAEHIWWSLDPRYEIQPGGVLQGHNLDNAFGCEAQLDAEEQAELTRLLNSADVLDRGSSGSCSTEPTYWTFEIEGTDGAAAGDRNVFRYDPCQPNAALDAVIATLGARIEAASTETVCDACPVELGFRCYGAEYGMPSICLGPNRLTCDADAQDDLARCNNGGWFACDDGQWVPATRWWLADPVIHHWPGGHELQVTLDIYAAGSEETLWDVPSMLEARDAAGEIVPLVAMEMGAFSVPSNTRSVVTQRYATDEISASIVTLSLRERRWIGVPFSDPVAVTHIDAAP